MSTNRTVASLGVTLLLTSVVILTACGGKEKARNRTAEEAVERVLEGATGKDVDVKMDGKSVRIEGEGYKADLAETAEWPTDIFPEVPEFTSGRVTNVSKGEDGGMKKKFNVFFRDLEESGIDKYVGQLKAAGWKVDRIRMGAKGGMVNGERGDLGMNFTYSAERKDGMLAVYRVPSE